MKAFTPTPQQLGIACLGHKYAEQAYSEGLLHDVPVQHLAALGKLTQFSLDTLRRAKNQHQPCTIWASGAVQVGPRVTLTPHQRAADKILSKSCVTVRLAAQSYTPPPKASLMNPNCQPVMKEVAKLVKKLERKAQRKATYEARKASKCPF